MVASNMLHQEAPAKFGEWNRQLSEASTSNAMSDCQSLSGWQLDTELTWPRELRLHNGFLEFDMRDASTRPSVSEPGCDSADRNFFLETCSEVPKKADADGLQHSSASHSAPDSWADAVDDDVAQHRRQLTLAQAGNRGSFAHPDLCARPCLNFMRGSCDRGDSCGFCHQAHTKRPAHLDKRHRDLVKSMSRDRFLASTQDLLRSKLSALGLSADEIQEFLRDTQLMPRSQQAGSANRAMRMLLHSLASLPLRAFLQCLQISDEHGPKTQDATAKLRELCWRKAH